MRNDDVGVSGNDRCNPQWDQVTAYFAAMPYVPTLEFMGRINDIALLFKNLLALYETDGRPALEYRMHRGLRELAREFFDDNNAVAGMSVEAHLAAFDELSVANTKRKLAQFELRIINQALVALCTVLDEFLCRVVDAIARANQHILFGTDAANKISLKNAIELGSLEALTASVRGREVAKFSHLGIEKKFRYLVKLGLNEDKLFDGTVFDANFNPRIADWQLDELVAIYDKRHEIVHRDALVLDSFDQVSDTVDFFNRICMWVSVEVPKAFPGVPNEFTRDAVRGQAYRDLRANAPAAPIDHDTQGQ